jgi:MarR family transcriptional regulator, organic hydroperoxide resistance regulator
LVRFDEIPRPVYIVRVSFLSIDLAIERVQFAYPQIYYACHTRHERRRSTVEHVSTRDSEILVHLDRRVPMTLSELAAHMDLAASTLSEAVSHLEAHGYVHKAPVRDRRRVALLLTPKGVSAVRAASVLEGSRLKTMLMRLNAGERRRAIEGLALLADACRRSGKRSATA